MIRVSGAGPFSSLVGDALCTQYHLATRAAELALGEAIHEQVQDRELGEVNEIEILPNGEIRAVGGSDPAERGFKKPLTMREDLGGEYGARSRPA